MTDTAEHWLRRNFVEALGLPTDACDWLIDLWAVIQVFDDIVDGDPVRDDHLISTVWRTLVTMPVNPFFVANSAQLYPVLANAILKWQAANDMEASGQADERSFIWRASYYDVVMLAVFLCHGQAEASRLSSKVLTLYAETFADYRREFPNA